MWFGHRDTNIFTHHVCGERAGDGFESDAIGNTFAEVRGEAAKATRSIAAHFGFAAIGVVIAESVVRAVLRRFDCQQSVGAYAAVTIAEGFDRLSIKLDGEVAVVDDAGAVHFVKLEEHRVWDLSESISLTIGWMQESRRIAVDRGRVER
ncbi:MAG: hypothetical protein RIR37_318 [Verrucomicrobiota bacterium]